MYRCTESESPLFILYHIESNIAILCAVSNQIESVNTVS